MKSKPQWSFDMRERVFCVQFSTHFQTKEIFSEKPIGQTSTGSFAVKEGFTIDDKGTISKHLDFEWFGVPFMVSRVEPPEWWNKRPRIALA